LTETAESYLSPPPETNSEVHTFLFADVRGYTRFTQDRGDKAAAELVAKFIALMREGVQNRGGQLVEIRGDEALAVFGSARQALRAAIELQARFAAETEADPTLPLSVGMGVEMGEAVRFEDGFRGEALNLAARLCNLAQPNEILTTEGVVYLGRRLDGVRYIDRGGAVQLKGLDEPVRVLRVVRQDENVILADSASRQGASLPIGTYLGALPNGILVGREQEWAQIMGALDEASKGLGRLVLLSGEPGVGKTRLAQEVTLKAQHWGFLVATGRCYEPEQAVPFYPFLEALGAVYNAASAALRSEIPRRWPYLARLLPEQIGVIPESVIHGDEDQQWLFRAVTHLLSTMAEEMPMAILLDDLHWVDDSSLKLIQHLARYTRGSRILLLGTYRDVEVHRQHPLERMLLDLSREGLVDELPVRRLEKKDTAELMSEILGHDEDLSDLVDLVHERTGGNAFFVQEMVHALVDNGSVFRRDGHWERRRVEEMEVPKSVRSVIGQRLSRLTESAQEVLREASVLGQEFAFDDVLALLRSAQAPHASGNEGTRQGWTEDEIDDALRSAREAGLVREKDGDLFAFNHALTQQALYAELSTRRRKRLHLAAGRVLEGLSEKSLKRRSPELAWHFLEGDDPEQAYRYAVMAGEQSETVFANGEAEKHYRTALELARELDDEAREADVLERLGGVLTLTAKYDKALDLLERAAKLHAELGNGESERCVLAKIGHAHYQQGSWRDGIERLQPVVAALDYHPDEIEPSRGYAAVYASLARLYSPAERWREMLAAAERAVELASAVGDSQIAMGAEITRTSALWELGQEEDALRSIEDVIPRAEAAGDITNLSLAWGYAAIYYARRGEFEKDRTYHERALELAERRGDRGQTVLQLMNLSSNFFHVGDWPQAKTYLERAEGIMQNLPVSRMTTWPTGGRAWLCLRQGDLEEASRHARELMLHASSMASESWRRQGLRVLGEAALLDRRPQEALQHLEQALDDEQWKSDPGFLRTLSWAYLESGNLARASDMASRAVAQSRAYRDQPELVESLVVRGTVLTKQQSWDDAAETFEYALAGAHAMQFPFGEARAMMEYGRLYALRGQADRAREYLESAIEIFKRLGARRDQELAAESLSELTLAET
jgi:class 3 adenylate cyclase/tetratricopeptide (TPR) repeat protein